jgi:hypothetical protein
MVIVQRHTTGRQAMLEVHAPLDIHYLSLRAIRFACCHDEGQRQSGQSVKENKPDRVHWELLPPTVRCTDGSVAAETPAVGFRLRPVESGRESVFQLSGTPPKRVGIPVSLGWKRRKGPLEITNIAAIPITTIAVAALSKNLKSLSMGLSDS